MRYLIYDEILGGEQASEMAEDNGMKGGEDAAARWFEEVSGEGEWIEEEMPKYNRFICELPQSDANMYYDYGADYYFAVKENKINENKMRYTRNDIRKVVKEQFMRVLKESFENDGYDFSLENDKRNLKFIYQDICNKLNKGNLTPEQRKELEARKKFIEQQSMSNATMPRRNEIVVDRDGNGYSGDIYDDGARLDENFGLEEREEYTNDAGISYANFVNEMNSDEWYGIDADNETSLGEYNFLIRKGNGTEYDVIYCNYYQGEYEHSGFDARDLAEGIMNTSDFEGFCKSCDINPDEFMQMAIERPEVMLSDIDSYWGLYNWL